MGGKGRGHSPLRRRSWRKEHIYFVSSYCIVERQHAHIETRRLLSELLSKAMMGQQMFQRKNDQLSHRFDQLSSSTPHCLFYWYDRSTQPADDDDGKPDWAPLAKQDIISEKGEDFALSHTLSARGSLGRCRCLSSTVLREGRKRRRKEGGPTLPLSRHLSPTRA